MPSMYKALSQIPGTWQPPSTANLSIANHVGQTLQGETKIKKKINHRVKTLNPHKPFRTGISGRIF